MKKLFATLALLLVFGFVASNAAEATATFSVSTTWTAISITPATQDLDFGDINIDLGTPGTKTATFNVAGAYEAPYTVTWDVDNNLTSAAGEWDITAVESVIGATTLGTDGTATITYALTINDIPNATPVGDYTYVVTCTVAY